MTRTSTDKKRGALGTAFGAIILVVGIISSSESDLLGRAQPSRSCLARRRRPAPAARDHGLARIHRLRREQDPVSASHAPHRAAPPKTWNLSEQDPERTPRPGCACFSPWTKTSSPGWTLWPRTSSSSSSSSRAIEAGHPRPEKDLHLRLRRDRPAGQADGMSFLAAVLEEGQGRRRSSGPKLEAGSPRRRGRPHRRDDGRRPGPDQLARGVRGPASSSAGFSSRTGGSRQGDVVICVTEGGETSSVIGTILGALDQWKAERGYDPAESRKKLYFVYNNPDDKLLPFERSRKVIEEPGITKINLTTGPQAITGLDADAGHDDRNLRHRQRARDSGRSGFCGGSSQERDGPAGIQRGDVRSKPRLEGIRPVLEEVRKNVPAIAALTDPRSQDLRRGAFLHLFRRPGLITVFIDSTERSPTFRLFPSIRSNEPQTEMLDPGLDRGAGLEKPPGGPFSAGRSAGSTRSSIRSPSRKRSKTPIFKRKPWKA